MIINDRNNQKIINDFMSKKNAEVCFQSFLDDVKNGDVKEDGTNDLFNMLDRYVLDDSVNEFRKTLLYGTFLYRAREITNDSASYGNGLEVMPTYGGIITRGYDEANSRECPLGMGKSGRNNIAGVSYIYLANRPETACAEIKTVVGSLISVASFKVTKPITIIDFSSDELLLSMDNSNDKVSLRSLISLIMRRYWMPVKDSDEYRVTQIITDHIRKTGIDGIAYKSVYDEKGINYTIFNCSRSNLDFVGSRIMALQSERRTFLDFDNECVHDVKTIGRASYDAMLAYELIKKIEKK